MKNIIYLLILMSSLSAHAQTETGFVINGTITGLEPSSMAYLSYDTDDTTVVDSTAIKNGKFTFEGMVSEPQSAYVQVRHGKSFSDDSSEEDYFGFLLENTTMKITANDSIGNAVLSGSLLNEQEEMISAQINPLRQKMTELGLRYKNKPKDEAYEAAVDTVKVLQEKMITIYGDFIDSNRDSYLALQYFNRIQLDYNFDPIVAEIAFGKFPEKLRHSAYGKETLKKIELAKKSEEGATVANFTQKTIDGNSFTLSSLKGKYVLVEFWASWCAPCRAENPNLRKLYHKLKDDNFEIVGISLDDADTKAAWVNAVKIDSLPWIQVSDLQGFDNEVAKVYGIKAIPQNFLVNPEGIIVAKNLRGEELAERLDEIFNN